MIRALVSTLLLPMLGACSGSQPSRTELPELGERIQAFAAQANAPDRAKAAIARHGCSACHRIPGIPGADSHTGPPLTNYPRQIYIAGVIPNTPENLIAWIRDPQAIDPRSAMPDLAVSEAEAQTIAAYLYGRGEGE